MNPSSGSFWMACLSMGATIPQQSLANDKVWVGKSIHDARAWDDADNWSPPGAPSNGDRVSIGVPPNSGTFLIKVSQSIELTSLALQRSSLEGAANIVVNGTFASEGGSLSGGLKLVLKSGGSAKRGGGGEFGLGLYGCRIDSAGVFTVSTNSTLGFSQQPSTFRNTGTVELQGGASISFNSAGDSLFDNAGTLQNAADGSISSVDNVIINNTGAIRARSGTLRFSLGRVTNNASIRANDGATNLFAVGCGLIGNPGSSLAGSGWHRFVGATYAINGTNAASNLEFDGGASAISLAPAAELQLQEIFHWSSGTIAGIPGSGRVIAGASASYLRGPGQKRLSGAQLDANSEMYWSDSGSVVLDSGAKLVNAGIFHIENDSTMSGPGFFLNRNILSKRSTNTVAVTGIDSDFNNEGSVELLQGNLDLSGGNSPGKFDVSKDARLRFRSRTHVLRGATFTGAGFTIVTDTATWDVREKVQASRLALAGAGIARILLGAELSVSGQFDWSAGTVATPESLPAMQWLTLGKDCDGLLCGSLRKTLQRARLLNLGQLVWQDNGDLVAADGAVLENHNLDGGGILNINGDASLLGGGRLSRLVNRGRVTKRSPVETGATVIGAGVTFENPTSGQSAFNFGVELNSGELRLEGGGTFERPVRLAVGTTLNLRLGSYTNSSTGNFLGDGWLRIRGGHLHYGAGLDPFTLRTADMVADHLELADGSLEAEAVNIFGFPTLVNFVASREFRWTGGRIGGDASSVFYSGFESFIRTDVQGPGKKVLDATVARFLGRGDYDGSGSIELARGGRIQLGSEDRKVVFNAQTKSLITDPGRVGEIRVSPGSELNLLGSGSIESPMLVAGNLRLLAGGDWSVYKLDVMGGLVDMDSGSKRLKVTSGITLTYGGQITGSGTVQGTVKNSGGKLNPGHSPGRLVIEGDYAQDAAGRTELELAGDAEAEMDRLEISGAATLDGTLELRLLGGFAPKDGDRFELVRFGSRTTTFAVKEGFILPGDLRAVAEYSKTNLVLAIQPASVIRAVVTFTRNANGLVLHWPAVPGQVYQVEYSNDLTTWLVLQQLEAAGGQLELPEPMDPAEPRRFYRLR